MEDKLLNINKIGLKFLEPISLKSTYSVILANAIDFFDAEYGCLYMAENNTLQQAAWYPKKLPFTLEIKKNGFIYSTFKKQQVNIISEKQIYDMHPELTGTEFKSAICSPLTDHKKNAGVILLFSKKKLKFTKKDSDLFSLFGSYASLAIRKAKLYEDKQQALEMRDFFISMAAHELRTPLTAVNGYIQLLYSKLHASGSNEAKWSKNLLWESQRLTLLINELLEVDRIKTGEMHYQWNYRNLRTIIERAITTLRFTFPKRTIIFTDLLENDSDAFVGDFDKILQAITNVLDNAAKFSPMDRDILITLSSSKKNLILTVQDFGMGISDEVLPKIYEGYAVHKANEVQGMGLGLYLVKNILRLHKGSIKIKTKEKKGTTVELTLPKA